AKPPCAALQDDGRITFHGHAAVGADMAVAICQRLRRSRGVWERVAYLVRNHLRLVQAPEMRLSTLKRMLREDGFDELLALARMDALASNRDLRYVGFCERRRAELAQEERRPARLLAGDDLIALGSPPAPCRRRRSGSERPASVPRAARRAVAGRRRARARRCPWPGGGRGEDPCR